MEVSNDCWPADTLGGTTSYGGLFIRLAWHCAGTFRTSDGAGGCSGGRQRFDPEASWDDNTNLDKARALLYPIKEKYGDALSWGDLFVFAGTAAIKQFGGPVTEVCAGRIDDTDGTNSDILNEACDDQGNCGLPHGASTVGLIYVNPQGIDGIPDPAASATRIREIFGRMGMNDTETVALIGGGHAFGKSHGACAGGAGESPSENPTKPWAGTCNVTTASPVGRGLNTATSGIEGQWTTYPFRWDNEFFTQLIDYQDNYTLITGPGGAYQWRNEINGYLMLTTDLALIDDMDYYDIVEEFATDMDSLNTAFGNVWEKLMTNGGVWAANKQCVTGDDVIDTRDVCPYTGLSTMPNGEVDDDTPDYDTYNTAVASLDVAAVFEDIYALLTDSQDCWPADTLGGSTNYGGLFIRLAWHCAGTFRTTDGEGGCAGGRQRFDPEASWDDNTNLDKARALLTPIKIKYGDALSWGDLFVFAGTASIISMGGPATEICYGRVDDNNGTNSDILNEPCDDPNNALCGEPHGATTVGLIYVNPEGVSGVPDPVASAARIREVFGRMGMNDTETVALIGGGHAFGKSHGACTTGAGPNPSEQPLAPWPGTCEVSSAYATGRGLNTATSGIEGQWTTYPFRWDNEFFTQLIEDDYTMITGSGGKFQWTNDRNGYMMLTTDLALINDADYLEIVTAFANDINVLNDAFGAVWAKLMSNGGSFADNGDCIDASDLIEESFDTCPYVQQSTMPNGAVDDDTPDVDTYNTAVANLDIAAVFEDLYALMIDSQDCWPADTLGGVTHYGGLFIRLAWHCAGTYRDTDGAGGCTGGRQRFDPEASWDDNTNLDKARALLTPIKIKYGDALSWGDLFVFAGTAAIVDMGGPLTEVCAGRIDDNSGENSEVLGFNNQPLTADPPCTDQGNCVDDNEVIGAVHVGLIYVNPQGVDGVPEPEASAARIREVFGRMGMNDTETVALIGGGHAFGKCHGACSTGPGPNPSEQPRNPWPGTCSDDADVTIGRGTNTFTSGIEGQWTATPFVWTNDYFSQLIDDTYTLETSPAGAYQWRNDNTGLLMLTTDLALVNDDEYLEISKAFADDIEYLNEQFGAVWEKLMTNGGSWAENKICTNGETIVTARYPTMEPTAPADGVDTYYFIVTWCIVSLVLSFAS